MQVNQVDEYIGMNTRYTNTLLTLHNFENCTMIWTFRMAELALAIEDKVVENCVIFLLELESPHSNIGVKSYDQNTVGRRRELVLQTYGFMTL